MRELKDSQIMAACQKELVSQLEDEADWKRAAVSKGWPEMEAFVGGRDAINAFLSAIGKRPWK